MVKKRAASRASKATAPKKAKAAATKPKNATAVLDATILETLAKEKRLPLYKLAFYARYRLGKRQVKVSETASLRAVKALAARGLIEITQVRGLPSCALADTKQTRAVIAATAKQTKERAAARAKSTPLPRTRCYVLSELEPLYPKLADAIRARFTVVGEKPSAIDFRWTHALGEGPLFRIEPSSRAEVRKAMGGGRYSFRDVKRFAGFAVLSFAALDEVLDEANGLIEAQGVLAKAANGPLYNAWNHGWIELD